MPEDPPAWPRSSVPTANFSTTRNWTDANGNFYPDCDLRNPALQDLRGSGGDLCGPYNNPSVATFTDNTTVADPDFTSGWFKRGYNWRATVSIEQQIMNRFAVSATYARTIYGNFTVTDNLNLTPGDYDPYCITLPVDSRLPRSGQQLCGLYDQRTNVATSNLVTFADNYVDRYSLAGLEQSRPDGALQRLRSVAGGAAAARRNAERRMECRQHDSEHRHLGQRRSHQQRLVELLRRRQSRAADQRGRRRAM